MGVWYCDVCESILPDYRCYKCRSNLCKEHFNIYLKNLGKYIKDKKLEKVIDKQYWDSENIIDNKYWYQEYQENEYLCKNCVLEEEELHINFEKSKQINLEKELLEFE